MHITRLKRPSPAFVVAMIALFVALGGTAGAVATQAVPLAKRALTADKAKVATVAENAKKLNGVTAGQLGAAAVQLALKESPAGPRPASTAAGLVTIKTTSASLAADGEGEFTITCDTGQKVMGGGFSSTGPVVAFDSFAASDASWRLYLVNLSTSTGASVSLYATCLK